MAVSQEDHERLHRELQEWKSDADNALTNFAIAFSWSAFVSSWIIDAYSDGDTENLSEGYAVLRSINFSVNSESEWGEMLVNSLAQTARYALKSARRKEEAGM